MEVARGREREREEERLLEEARLTKKFWICCFLCFSFAVKVSFSSTIRTCRSFSRGSCALFPVVVIVILVDLSYQIFFLLCANSHIKPSSQQKNPPFSRQTQQSFSQPAICLLLSLQLSTHLSILHLSSYLPTSLESTRLAICLPIYVGCVYMSTVSNSLPPPLPPVLYYLSPYPPLLSRSLYVYIDIDICARYL